MSSANRPRVLIIARNAEGDALGAGLRSHAEIVAIEGQASLGLIAARTHKPDLCLVFLDHEPDASLELTRQLQAEAVSVPIVVSSNKHPDNILRAMRAGARDFAHFDGAPGASGAAADALRAIRDYQQAQASVRPPRACKIITVFGCKGGAGATTVATNLAHAIRVSAADPGERPEVAIIDFDTMLGDVLVMLDLKNPYGFRDLLDNMPRLDADLLRTSLARHDSGFHVLAGAGQADPMAEFAPADLDRILSFLAAHFDYVVIDGVRDFHEAALVALDRADSVLCVMTQDLPSLKNANRALKLFDTLGYASGKLQLVINRYSSGRKLTLETIADALGHQVDATVQNDFPTVSKCVDAGVLITEKEPGSKVGKDLRALAGLYHKPATEKRRGLFSLWGKP
jgi:pilus assembly protein CpaE